MRFPRRLIAAALALSALLAASGCSAPAGTGERVLRIARAESFDGWDPDKASAYASYQTLQAVLEPMLRLNPDGVSIDPGIATRWESDPAKRRWTFTLRDDVRFSDGSPLTSADVAFSVQQWKAGPNYGGMYAQIARVETPDARTVRFDLSSPDASFPVFMTWSSSAIYPKGFGGRTARQFFAKPVGAGPFEVDRWSPGGRIVLTRSPHYYLPGRPHVDRVVIDVVEEDAETMFEAGQLDIVEYVSPLEASRFGDELRTLAPSQVEHLSLNRASRGLGDRRVREALAHAVDSDAIRIGAFRGKASAPSGILPPGLPGVVPPTVPMPKHDPALARELLRKAGAKDLSYEVIYDASNSTDVLIAQILQAGFEQVGVRLKLSGLETGTFIDRAYGHDADMVLWSFGAVSPDVVDPMSWFTGTSWLFSGLDTGPLLGRIDEYRRTADPAERERIVAAVQDAAVEELPAINLAQYSVQHAVKSNVSGFAPTPWGMYALDTIEVGRK
ncbi:ABC transporter substrate-binding protein [Leucobacter iarius]|uniref:ABC transporter substrate-binding protein n=1 Tax=Leucobacter iarius TaxID=333963 RepID=A0ABN2L656_9MICO